jgi:hypothetical protein
MQCVLIPASAVIFALYSQSATGPSLHELAGEGDEAAVAAQLQAGARVRISHLSPSNTQRFQYSCSCK